MIGTSELVQRSYALVGAALAEDEEAQVELTQDLDRCELGAF